MSATSPRPLDSPAPTTVPTSTPPSVPPPARRSGRAFGEDWSGGQWSVVRVLIACFLAGHFALRIDRDGTLVSMPSAMIALGLLASFLLAFGALTRVNAVVLLAVGGWFLFQEAWPPRPAACGFLLPLLALLVAPPAPFGSLTARGRTDPDGGWRLPSRLFALLWIGVAAISLWTAIVKLQASGWREGAAVNLAISDGNAVLAPVRVALQAMPPWLQKSSSYFLLGAELLFVPLALFRVTRPLAWCALLLRHLAALPLAGLRDEHLGMAVTLLFLFDPAWLPPRKEPRREFIYFDGHCGLCHRLIRFLLAEDRVGLFSFSPLQGQAIRAVMSEHARAGLPDSVLVQDVHEEILIKSNAIAHVYDRLGGLWRITASLLRLIPRPLRDLGYDLVARSRRRLFKRPDESCPLIPPELKERFVS